jgi:hypothetical protein
LATALEVIQNVALEINLPRPSAVTNNGQDLAGRAFQLLKTAGKRLATKNWPELVYEHEFIPKKNQPYYDLPDDYDRLIPDTGWDRIDARPITPMNASEWQEWKSGLVKVAVWDQYRIKAVDGARKIFINPTPTETACTFQTVDGKQVKIGFVVEYISKHWCETSAGAGLAAPTAGTDVIRLPEDIIEAELKWRWLRSLSRSYADEKLEAEQLISLRFAHADVLPRIKADGGGELPYPNIPETGIGIA